LKKVSFCRYPNESSASLEKYTGQIPPCSN
jgi:hypothetical protein